MQYLYLVILRRYVGPLPLPWAAGVEARHEECGVVSGEPFLDLLEKSFQVPLGADGEDPNEMGSTA